MLNLNVVNETSKLKAVVLGTAVSLGPAPKLEDCIDSDIIFLLTASICF